MILAELNVRHTRRHMPTRRVALGPTYLPTAGPAPGLTLLSAVAAHGAGGLDDDQLDLLPRFLRAARSGLTVPRIALRYRLQTDVHGLDFSRHRLLGEGVTVVVELDVHASPVPQLVGAVMAAAAMGPTPRRAALRAIETAVLNPGIIADPLMVRLLVDGVPRPRPAPPPPGGAAGRVYAAADATGAFGFGGGGYGGEGIWGANGAVADGLAAEDPRWRGIPADLRWAREVLGLGPTAVISRRDVQRRFRRLVSQAHPDHGGTARGAAERIATLTEARSLLLGVDSNPA